MGSGGGGWVVSGSGKGVQNLMGLVQWGRGGARLSENLYTCDPPIYDITSGCKVAALFWREAPRWTPDAIWFLRYFNPQANGIMYLECREC